MSDEAQKLRIATLDERGTRQHPLLPRDKHCGARTLEHGFGPALDDTALGLGHHTITKREFILFQELIHRDAGIWLSTAKTALLVGRLAKRLRLHGLRSFGEYYNLVTESAEERVQMLDAISTNETHFFREPKHFELLQTSILPAWAAAAEAGRPRRIRAWSAGCSSGQEPYSLAMVLLQHFPLDSGWEIEVIATDLSTRVLEIAQRGIWPREKTREIPPEYLRSFMLKGRRDQAGNIKAGPEIQSVIRFFRLNLNDSSYPFTDKFDLIFCRNVLIYFDLQGREDIVHRLVNCLRPDGYIFLGHAETMPTIMNSTLRVVCPTVYQLGGRLGQNNGQ